MLIQTTPTLGRAPRASAPQQGIVLIITLIVLVAMTLAAIALVRSSDTNNLIAGNLSFQQSAMHSADTGVETAVAWLSANSTGSVLDSDDRTNGYAAAGMNLAPSTSSSPPQSWEDYWSQSLAARAVTMPKDSAGNTVSYVIDRLCNSVGARTAGAGCISSPSVGPISGNSEEAGEKQLNAPSAIYYRITTRVAGPKNTVSFVQAIVAL